MCYITVWYYSRTGTALLFWRDFLPLFSFSSSSVVKKPSLYSSQSQKLVRFFSPLSGTVQRLPLQRYIKPILAPRRFEKHPDGGMEKWCNPSHHCWHFEPESAVRAVTLRGAVGNMKMEKGLQTQYHHAESFMTSCVRAEPERCSSLEPNHSHSLNSCLPEKITHMKLKTVDGGKCLRAVLLFVTQGSVTPWAL